MKTAETKTKPINDTTGMQVPTLQSFNVACPRCAQAFHMEKVYSVLNWDVVSELCPHCNLETA